MCCHDHRCCNIVLLLLPCSIHDVPCCVMCIRDDHRHCQELRSILEDINYDVLFAWWRSGMVPVTVGTQEILTFRAPDGRQFRFVVMITDVATLCSIGNYQKLPSYIVSIKNRCDKHGNKYELYCSIHDVPCCVMCIRDDHRHCQKSSFSS
jgi:hypothetical protein